MTAASSSIPIERGAFRLPRPGSETWACIASLVETCKLTGVAPQAYLADVLTRLVNLWLAARIDELMPWAWAAEGAAKKLAA